MNSIIYASYLSLSHSTVYFDCQSSVLNLGLCNMWLQMQATTSFFAYIIKEITICSNNAGTAFSLISMQIKCNFDYAWFATLHVVFKTLTFSQDVVSLYFKKIIHLYALSGVGGVQNQLRFMVFSFITDQLVFSVFQ